MLPDRVSNPEPLTYESGALPIALCGPAGVVVVCITGWTINPGIPRSFPRFFALSDETLNQGPVAL